MITKLPMGILDSIFLTKARRNMIGSSLLGMSLLLITVSISIFATPVQDYEHIRGKILTTDEGYIFIPYEFHNATNKEESNDGRSETE